MKLNKRYIFASIAAQMIVVPVILTIGLFIITGMPGLALALSRLGEDASRLMYFIIALAGSLLTGTIVGFIFSKLSKHNPDAKEIKYKAALVPVVYALTFCVFLIIFSSNNYNSSWWGIYILKNPAFLLFGFVLFFIGLHSIITVSELIGYMGFILGIFLYEFICDRSSGINVSKGIKLSCAIMAIACIFVSSITAKEVISNGFIELRYGKSTIGSDLTEADLASMAPFKEDNRIAKLDKPAALQFTEIKDMPRLDGATAAYPVYSAFTEAVYKGLGEYYDANKKNFDKELYTAFIESSEYPLDIIKCSKTGRAYERLINGETDIIFVAEPSKEQLEFIKEKGDEFLLTPIGNEAFVFFTNKQNAVDNLTIKQIQDIYSGNITNWKEVGGKATSIRPYQRPENSGSQTVMENKVMKDVKMLEPTQETYASSMGEIISRVGNYKNAINSIGYSFMYYSSEMVKNNQIKYISIDGIKPTAEALRNRNYPFAVPVYAVTLKSNKNENINRLIEWILSEEGQYLVEKTGYAPVK